MNPFQLGTFLLLAILLCSPVSCMQTWYVSWNATSSDDCGRSLSKPCPSLSNLLGVVSSNDVVQILSSFSADVFAASSSPPNCSSLLPDIDSLAPPHQRYACENVEITIPLVLSGLGGLAVFDCKQQNRAFHFVIEASDQSNGPVTIDHVLVMNGLTKTKSGGGAILIEPKGNDPSQTVGVQLSNSCFFKNIASVASGGAVSIINGHSSQPMVSQCYFEQNEAADSGGGLSLANQANSFQSFDLVMQGNDFRSNRADVAGGGLYIGLALTSKSSWISNCVLLVTFSTFTNNSITSTSSASEMTVRGGALSINLFNSTTNSQVVLTDLTCTSNTIVVSGASTGAGGAIDVYVGDAFDFSSVTLTRVSIVGNSLSSTGNGPVKGGGVAVRIDGQSTSPSTSVLTSSFDSNMVRGLNAGSAGGGGFCLAFRNSCTDPRLSMQTTLFTANTALSSIGNSVGGAVDIWFGMSSTASLLMFANVQAYRNLASGGGSNGNAVGGGIGIFYNNYGVSGIHRFDSCMFSSNSGFSPNNGNSVGGGLAIFFNNEAFNNTITLTKNTFDSNALSGAQQGIEIGGGAAIFYNDQSKQNEHYFDHCVFSQNSIVSTQNGVSTGGGLALFNNNGQSDDTVEQFSANIFDQNTAMTCAQYVLSPLHLCK